MVTTTCPAPGGERKRKQSTRQYMGYQYTSCKSGALNVFNLIITDDLCRTGLLKTKATPLCAKSEAPTRLANLRAPCRAPQALVAHETV
eukprot:6176573-Pleurochrysis_carterae.AAC.5